MIELQGIEKFISQLESKVKSALPKALPVIAAGIKREIDLNFISKGRWDGSGTGLFSGGSQKWKPLAKSTIKRYQKKGYDLNPTLRRKQGGLFSAIAVLPSGNRIRISARMPYAKIHQFGGVVKQGSYSIKSRKKGSYKITIPARPYLNISKDRLKRIIKESLSTSF